MNKYTEWIQSHKFKAGECLNATLKMQETFPELKRIKGWYVHSAENKYNTHWWCEDPRGNIYDPTQSQYPAGGIYQKEAI